MFIVDFNHIFSQFFNALFKLIDFGLVLFPCFNKDEIIAQKVLDSPEYGFVEKSNVIDYFCQLSIVYNLILGVKVVNMLVDYLQLFFANKVDTVLKVYDSFMNVCQINLHFRHQRVILLRSLFF